MTGTQENRHCVGRVKGISPLEPSPFLHATPMMLEAAVAPSYCSNQTNDCEGLFFSRSSGSFCEGYGMCNHIRKFYPSVTPL